MNLLDSRSNLRVHICVIYINIGLISCCNGYKNQRYKHRYNSHHLKQMSNSSAKCDIQYPGFMNFLIFVIALYSTQILSVTRNQRFLLISLQNMIKTWNDEFHYAVQPDHVIHHLNAGMLCKLGEYKVLQEQIVGFH